ncbi:MAG: cytochrome c [Bacteriovoracaceae bacterium]|nr:cytochrome c [Bacteroidota bacterium]
MQLKDEIDFQELLKNPVRLFGLTYVYFLVVAGFIGTYYIWSMNDVSKNTIAPVILRDSTQFVQDIPMQRGALIAPVNVTEVGRTSKVLVDKGANLFQANCSSCHGNNGMGDGLSAAAMTVKPRNFHSAEGWKNGRKVSNMYKTLQEGIVLNGMQAFNYLPAEDRFAIIHYVRTFATDFPVDSLSELQDLEKVYNLSKGTQLPPQIPVKLAMQNLQNEAASDAKYVENVCSSIATKKQEEQGAMLAKRFSANSNKMITASLATKDVSLDVFIRTVSTDPITIGFKSAVVRLSREEWSSLYAYLSKVSKEKKS